MFRPKLSVSVLSLAGILGAAGIALASVTGILMPVGDGFWQRFFTSGSANHYQNVDDSTCNGATDYNYATTAGGKDSYSLDLSTIPNGSVITRIDVSPCASTYSDGAGYSSLNMFWRWDGLDSPMYGNFVMYNTTFSQFRPAVITGLSMTKTSSTVMEIGAYYNIGNLGVRVSNIRTQIYYQ